MRKASRVALCFLALSMTVGAGINLAADAQHARPQEWAQPLMLQGVPNLHKVSDTLYRSAQPTADGMKNLKKMRIVTVVNLRSSHSDQEKMSGMGLTYEYIRMKAWHPEEEDAVRFLRIVVNPARSPVLVHCQIGADRTGAMVAIYRVAVQGWTKEQAIKEMTKGGFGFNEVLVNLPPWIQGLDIDRVKRKAGIDK